jgi:hypothetical protein
VVIYRKVEILELQRIVTDLKQERDRLNRAIEALEGVRLPRVVKRKGTVKAPSLQVVKGKKSGGLTAEGRRRLSMAMKKRWAERKKKGS